MRLHSVTPYNQRLPSKNRRTDECKGLGMPERFNRFISYDFPTYSEKDDVLREDTIDDIFVQYPVKLNLNNIESKPMGKFLPPSLLSLSTNIIVPPSRLSSRHDILSPIHSIHSTSIDSTFSFAHPLMDYIGFDSHLPNLSSQETHAHTGIDSYSQYMQGSHGSSKETAVDSAYDDTSSDDVDSDDMMVKDSETGNSFDESNLVGWFHGDLYWEPVGLRPCSKLGSKYHCFTRSCQRCWKLWRDRVVWKIKKRLTPTQKDSLRHFSFSPFPEWGLKRLKSEGGFKYLRREAYRVMREVGVEGGVVIFHPWRVKSEVKEIIKKTYPDIPVWTYLRSHDLLSIDSETIELSPHFHLLAKGYLQKSDDFYKKTEWVYNNHKDFDGLEDELKYLLSHTGLAYSIDDTERPLFKSYSFIGYFKKGGGQ